MQVVVVVETNRRRRELADQVVVATVREVSHQLLLQAPRIQVVVVVADQMARLSMQERLAAPVSSS